MKTANTDLFELIKTLTKTEKTYFKRSAFDSGESKVYLKLFDAIDKQEVYDEKKLKEKFKQVKQFSVLKTQLYDTLLKSLGRLAESVNYSYKISAAIKHADQLFSRGLYSQSEKILAKAKSSAYQSEDFTSILQAINLEKKLILKQLQKDEKKIISLHKEENRVLALLKNLSEYNEMFTKTYLYFLMYGYLRNKEDDKKFTAYAGLNDFEKLREKTVSKRAEQFYYETLHLYYTSRFETESAMKYNRASLKLMEDNPALIKSNVERYLATFQNYVLQFFYKGDIKGLELAAEKLKEFLNDTNIYIPRLAKITSQGKLYDILISTYYDNCMFEKTGEIVSEAEKLIDDNFSVIDKSVKNITYQMGVYYYFTIEDYDNALSLANKLLNDPDSLKFLEVYCFILLLRLLIHYEMGNYELLDYITKSTLRYLSKQEKLLKIEKIMLAFFNKAINADERDKNEIYNRLFKELEELKKNKEENPLDYFDFYSWCLSKIKKIKFKQVLINNYNEKINAK